MISLDVATVLLQWATGGLLFLWVTTRRRVVGIGYGCLLRGVYGTMALGAFAAGRAFGPENLVRDTAAGACIVSAGAALFVSIVRRRAGVAGERADRARKVDRVSAMTGIDRAVTDVDVSVREFPPLLDVIAPVWGLIGIVAAALASGGSDTVSVLRVVAGALFLGAVSDAMLLGHWYLVQPGLDRAPLHELNRFVGFTWPVEVGALLLPTGMLSVLSGTIDDGYGGLLGWFWVACAVTTIVLVGVTAAALRERAYSAVMAATGLLYLAILTAFGTDLVARAVLSG